MPRSSPPATFTLLTLTCALAAGHAGALEPPATVITPVPPQPRQDDRAHSEPRLTPPILHALGLMTVMRVSEAYLWPEPFAETSSVKLGLHYNDAFSRAPLWDGSRPLFEEDGDRWQINVFGHGLFGSELYLRARTCHLPLWQALLFTTAASATWEYAIEGSGVRPSALDLTFTPLAGLVLGEGRYFAWRSARRLASGPLRSTLSAVVDPFGELERAFGAPC